MTSPQRPEHSEGTGEIGAPVSGKQPGLLRLVTTPVGWLFGQAYLLLALTMLMWGGNAVASRLAVGEISPMALTCLRWTVVIIISVVIAHKELVREWPVLRTKLPMILTMGAFGFTGFNALFYLGAHYTTAVNLTIHPGSDPDHRADRRAGCLWHAHHTLAGGRDLRHADRLWRWWRRAAEVSRLLNLSFNPGDLLMLSACVLYAGYTLGLRNRPKVSGLAFFAILASIAPS